MKNSSLLTCTAIALAIAAPAIAKEHSAAAHAALNHPLAKIETTTTKTGLVDTTTNGAGTFDETIIKEGKTTIKDTTDTFADGVTTTNVDTIHKTSDGWTSNDVYVGAKGKTTDTFDTATKDSTGYDINGKIITASGKVDTLSGQETLTSYGQDTTKTITNASGQTESLNTEFVKSGDAWGSVTSGTGFNGKAVDYASLYTTNTAPTANTGVNTVSGAFTYSQGSSTTNGVTTNYSDRVYASGAGSTDVQTVTPISSGGRTVDSNNTYVASNGSASSSTTDETYTPTGTGTSSISGTFTQSNNQNGTLSGQYAKTAYGSVNDVTYTNQTGATKIADTQQLKVGDAVLNINTDSTFQGKSNNSVGLINGQ